MKKTVQGFTVYREILPYIFSSLLPWMSAGEFKTEQITMFQGISFCLGKFKTGRSHQQV